MSQSPEYDKVEAPFIDQLQSMAWPDGSQCWKYTTGNGDDPSATGRESFRDVILVDDLKRLLRKINVDNNCEPWLDEDRLSQAANALTKVVANRLTEANQMATVEGWDNGRVRHLNFIHFENPQNNEFRVINQFRVECPPGRADKNIYPDLVLFVNGIPLVVVECKKPGKKDRLGSAVNQLQRYSNRQRELDLNAMSDPNFSDSVLATSRSLQIDGFAYGMVLS